MIPHVIGSRIAQWIHIIGNVPMVYADVLQFAARISVRPFDESRVIGEFTA